MKTGRVLAREHERVVFGEEPVAGNARPRSTVVVAAAMIAGMLR